MIRQYKLQDDALQTLVTCIRTGTWHKHPECKQYWSVKDELATDYEGTIVLKGTKIVIPAALQSKIINIAHEGHQGLSKTKALIRSKVWFPGIDSAVEQVIGSCIPCKANTTKVKSEPLKMSALPRAPWLHLSLDFCGPLPSGEYLMVLTDEYSRYPVVEVLRSTTADTVISRMKNIFAIFGYPVRIKTDNGPPFQSSTWSTFLSDCGVKHRKITPLWPKANSQAESFNKPLMKFIYASTTPSLETRIIRVS
jgi:hypothetical protein